MKDDVQRKQMTKY